LRASVSRASATLRSFSSSTEAAARLESVDLRAPARSGAREMRSFAIVSCSWRSTRDQERRALGTRRVASTASSFWPVKYVLKNSIVRHAEHTLQASRDFFERIGDDHAVLIKLGVVQAAIRRETP